MIDPKLREAVNQFLGKEPAKGFETLNHVMEQRAMSALQNQMEAVGKKVFGESVQKKV